jgi:transposase
LAYWRWLKTVKFEHSAQNVVLLECIVEVEHQGARIQRLDKAIDDAIAGAPRELKAVIEALQSLRGVAKITAVTVAVEVGTFQRFERATQLMSYTGIVPSERSSGLRERRGAITKAGNSHMRRVLIEAAHHYRHQPRLSARQRALQRELDPRVLEIAWKAQLRLTLLPRKVDVIRGLRQKGPWHTCSTERRRSAWMSTSRASVTSWPTRGAGRHLRRISWEFWATGSARA